MSGSERRQAGGVSARLLAISSEDGAEADVKPLDSVRDAISQMGKFAEQGKLFPMETHYELDDGQKAPRNTWLTAEMQNYKSSNGITEDTQPSEKMIRKQILLPNLPADQLHEFQEPIKQWKEVHGDHKIPDTTEEKKLTLSEDEKTPRDHPTVYRFWSNTFQYVNEFDKLKPVKPIKVFKLEDGENPMRLCQEWVEDNNNMEGPVILANKDGIVR